jgi:hypothetical protein
VAGSLSNLDSVSGRDTPPPTHLLPTASPELQRWRAAQRAQQKTAAAEEEAAAEMAAAEEEEEEAAAEAEAEEEAEAEAAAEKAAAECRFHAAASKGDLAALTHLVELGVDVDATDEASWLGLGLGLRLGLGSQG